MWRRMGHITLCVTAALLFAACNVTRQLPKGSYLLQKVKIEDDKSTPRRERITAEEVSKYIRQTPNEHFLGTNFYVWVYNLANPEKDNWWNNLKRRIGEEPVLYDQYETEKSVDNLKVYLDSRGYFASEVDYAVDTSSIKRRAKVTYSLRQNNPYIIDNISYIFRDRFLEPILLPDTVNRLIHRGDIFNIATLDAERERITTLLKERGYYGFNVNNIEYIADTLQQKERVALTMIIKQKLTGYNSKGVAQYDNNAVYRLRNVSINPNYNATSKRRSSTVITDTIVYRGLNVLFGGKRPTVRPKVLRPIVSLYPNAVYNNALVQRTYNNLMQTNYFKSGRIIFKEVPDSVIDTHHLTYVGGDSLSLNYTRERYLDCEILCTPALKQGIKAELEASATSSFYGVKANLGYQNRNIFRGADMLEVGGTVGYEYMTAPDARRRSAIEFGLSVGLSFPRFLIFRTSGLSRFNVPRTRFDISYNHQNRPYYRRDLTSIVWSYSWRNAGHSSFVVRPISVNWVDVGYIDNEYFQSLQNEYLKRSYESQLIAAISASYAYNKVRNQGLGDQTTIRTNVELAGNIIDGLTHLFSKPVAGKDYYDLFGIRFSQYFRADFNVSHKFAFGKVTALAMRFYAGVGVAYGNSQAMPFDRMFYCGGANSMRGWAPRTLGPGSSPLPDNVIYPTQMGDMKLEANIEFRFPIWGIFQGATFIDAGNVWYIGRDGVEYPDSSIFRFDTFYKQLGLNTGIGLRLDIKFAILRLDWGIQLHSPNRPAGERWIHNFKWKNTSLNFGVGFPF